MNPVIKNGYETDLDTGIIIDLRLPKVIDTCRHCKKNNHHVKVVAIQKWGYGLNQIMAFFKCQICGSSWYYDVVRHQNYERLVREGIIDPKTRRFTPKFEDDCKRRARETTDAIFDQTPVFQQKYVKNIQSGR